jgi:hypothetical protein
MLLQLGSLVADIPCYGRVSGYAFTSPHRTDRMSANPIGIVGKATFAIRTMRADDVTRKSEGTRSLVRIARIAFPSGARIRWSASNFSSSPIPPFLHVQCSRLEQMSNREVEIIISCLLITRMIFGEEYRA